MAWILRYVSVMRSHLKGKPFEAKTSLSVNELQRAQTELIKCVLCNHFPYLLSNNSKQKLPHFMQKLDPVSVDGVMRVGGRIDRALADVDVKRPIILPQHSHFRELIIRQKHSEVGHAGTSHTWASVRRRFWIVKGGAAVRHLSDNAKSTTQSWVNNSWPICHLVGYNSTNRHFIMVA